MKIAYFGSSYFAKVVLQKLISYGREPSLIITTPDRPAGRGLELRATAVKELAMKENKEILTPSSLTDDSFIRRLKDEQCDLFVVVSYGKIIPKVILDFPRVMCLGLHPSLLPLYRGAAPINWAIINGEEISGVTVFRVEEKLDSGAIILQKKILIRRDSDAVNLSWRLSVFSAAVLLQGIDSIEKEDFSLTPQDEALVSFAPKLKKGDGRIDWQKHASSIRNLVRGLRGWPEAFTYYKNFMLKIIEVEVDENNLVFPPGTVARVSFDSIDIACGQGVVKIKKVKPQGKKEMPAQAFLCGYHIRAGERLG
ncbi:MAG: methionyl-tRNA formyltransferase [Candidatus Omnitrophota bacterium]